MHNQKRQVKYWEYTGAHSLCISIRKQSIHVPTAWAEVQKTMLVAIKLVSIAKATIAIAIRSVAIRK